MATEIALQLHAQGQQIGLLALFDSPAIFAKELENNTAPPNTPANNDAATFARFVSQLNGESGKDLATIYAELSQLTPENQLRYVLERAKIAGVVSAHADSLFINRLLRVYKADVQATVTYRPQMYAGRVTYFQCESSTHTAQATLQAWRKIAAGGLDLIEAPGTHFTMLKEPHVQATASRLQSCLTRSHADSS